MQAGTALISKLRRLLPEGRAFAVKGEHGGKRVLGKIAASGGRCYRAQPLKIAACQRRLKFCRGLFQRMLPGNAPQRQRAACNQNRAQHARSDTPGRA